MQLMSWEEAKGNFRKNCDDYPKLQHLLAAMDSIAETELVSPDELDTEFYNFDLVCYNLLQSSLPLAGYALEADLHGAWCGHHLYKPAKPEVRGITYPPEYQVLQHCGMQELHRITKCLKNAIYSYLCVEEINNTPQLFASLVDSWGKFIQPIVAPRGKMKERALYSAAERTLANQVPDPAVRGRVAVNNADYPAILKPGFKRPLRAIPAVEWFPDSVRALKPEQIITLFNPEVELKVFMLCIGRALCGPSGTIPVGYSDPIEHSHRTSLIIKGSAGSGKSQVLNLLNRTMAIYGYSTHAFRSLDGQFDLADVVEADFAVKDDSSTADLLALGKSAAYKAITTGGLVLAGRKYKDAVQRYARGVVLIATNDWDSNNSYFTDEGVRSRLRILDTLDPFERSTIKAPKQVVADLAKQTNTSPEAVMGWFYRMCLDYFYDSIPNLEQIDKALECRLSTRIQANPLRSLVKALKLALMLNGHTGYETLTPELLERALNSLGCLVYDCRTGAVLDAIKAHWEDSYRDTHHTWAAFKYIRYSSIKGAYERSKNMTLQGKGRHVAPEEHIKSVVGCISTHNSIIVGPSPSNFADMWSSPSVQNEIDQLFAVANPLLASAKGLFNAEIGKENAYHSWFKDEYTSNLVRSSRQRAFHNRTIK